MSPKVEDERTRLSFVTMLDLSPNNIKVLLVDDGLTSDTSRVGRSSALAIYDLLRIELAKRMSGSPVSKDASHFGSGKTGDPPKEV